MSKRKNPSSVETLIDNEPPPPLVTPQEKKKAIRPQVPSAIIPDPREPPTFTGRFGLDSATITQMGLFDHICKECQEKEKEAVKKNKEYRFDPMNCISCLQGNQYVKFVFDLGFPLEFHKPTPVFELLRPDYGTRKVSTLFLIIYQQAGVVFINKMLNPNVQYCPYQVAILPTRDKWIQKWMREAKTARMELYALWAPVYREALKTLKEKDRNITLLEYIRITEELILKGVALMRMFNRREDGHSDAPEEWLEYAKEQFDLYGTERLTPFGEDRCKADRNEGALNHLFLLNQMIETNNRRREEFKRAGGEEYTKEEEEEDVVLVQGEEEKVDDVVQESGGSGGGSGIQTPDQSEAPSPPKEG